MGVTLRAIALIVATALVTLSSAANAHYRHGAVRGGDWHGRQILLVLGAFGFWLALLLPLRPLSPLLQIQMSTIKAPADLTARPLPLPRQQCGTGPIEE